MNAAVKGSPIQVVTTGQSFFTPTIGLTAVQTMLQAQPDLNLIVGSDQGMEGAMTAFTTAHITKVMLVGYGASAAAVAGFPDQGVVTKADAKQFTPEWNG